MVRKLTKQGVPEVFLAERNCQFLLIVRRESILIPSLYCLALPSIEEKFYLAKVRRTSDQKWQKSVFSIF